MTLTHAYHHLVLARERLNLSADDAERGELYGRAVAYRNIAAGCDQLLEDLQTLEGRTK